MVASQERKKCYGVYKKLKGKYKVSINKKGFPRLAKRFLDLKSARLWAKEKDLLEKSLPK